jgi:hypothetical protein
MDIEGIPTLAGYLSTVSPKCWVCGPELCFIQSDPFKRNNKQQKAVGCGWLNSHLQGCAAPIISSRTKLNLSMKKFNDICNYSNFERGEISNISIYNKSPKARNEKLKSWYSFTSGNIYIYILENSPTETML